MREAAFHIASQQNVFSSSIAELFIAAMTKPVRQLSDAIALSRLKARLSLLDDHQLRDIGLTRSDIALIGCDGLGAKDAIARLKDDGKNCAWTCVAI